MIHYISRLTTVQLTGIGRILLCRNYEEHTTFVEAALVTFWHSIYKLHFPIYCIELNLNFLATLRQCLSSREYFIVSR